MACTFAVYSLSVDMRKSNFIPMIPFMEAHYLFRSCDIKINHVDQTANSEYISIELWKSNFGYYNKDKYGITRDLIIGFIRQK